MSKYKPYRDLVIIKLQKVDEKKTKSGIFIPENAWHEHEPLAEIIEVGSDVTLVKKGETVLVNPYAVLDIPNEEDIKIIKEIDIIANVG